MSESFICPFCNHTMPLIKNTFETQNVQFRTPVPGGFSLDTRYNIKIRMYKCPNCENVTSFADYEGSDMPNRTIPIHPISLAKQFPKYIPESIRQDYEEACAIVSLSPKASATLSRRCLQNMIRDFWQIKDKNTLYNEISSLEGNVPAIQWKVLNSLRRIGNIGAHPEADVNLIIDINPEDAKKLIAVIELLIKQWYIERHEQEQLYTAIIGLDESTQGQRKKTE